jgi:putative tricarboxylic transport membrane protein
MVSKRRLVAWMTADRVAALLFLGAVGVYGWTASTLSGALQVDVVGPGFFPKILTVSGVVLGLSLLFQPGREREGTDGGSGFAALLPALLLLFGYVLVLEPAGFPLATVVFLGVTFKYLGHPTWLGAWLLSLAATAAMFLLFYVALDLKLPLGLFAKLM